MNPQTIPQTDWYDPTAGPADTYRDGFCDEHGDTATVNLDGVWRCTICGASTERYAVADLHSYDGHADRLGEVGLLVSVAPSSMSSDYDGLTIRFEDGVEIMLFRYQLESEDQDPLFPTR